MKENEQIHSVICKEAQKKRRIEDYLLGIEPEVLDDYIQVPWTPPIITAEQYSTIKDARGFCACTICDSWKTWWNEVDTESPSSSKYEKVIMSEYLSYSLTIMNSLHSYSIMEKKEQLVVHIIGASSKNEASDVERMFELLLLLNEKASLFNKLDIVMIGDDIDEDMNNTSYHLSSTDHSSTIDIKMYRKLYHKFLMSANEEDKSVKPDLCICFHSGLHDDSYTLLWQPTVFNLLIKNVPVVFTSLDQMEHGNSLEILKSWNCNITFSGANPFMSLLLQQLPNDRNQLFRTNHYSIGIRGYCK